MKTNTFNPSLQAGVLVGALLLACVSANASSIDNISITVDENGHATSTGGILTQGSMGVEEWISPGQQINVLKYWTSSSTYAMAGGIINIHDGTLTGPVSDVISFFPDGVWYLEFMSLDNNGAMADIASIPTGLPAVSVNLVEGQTYTPTSNQPGFITGFNTTYTFTSDGTTVPDGGVTVGLLGMSLVGIAALKRKLAK